MTEHYRVCGLGICEPSIVILGVRYGVCPLKQACDPTRLCGYLAAHREIEIEPAVAAAFSLRVRSEEQP
jgi:hypothetical protein